MVKNDLKYPNGHSLALIVEKCQIRLFRGLVNDLKCAIPATAITFPLYQHRYIYTKSQSYPFKNLKRDNISVMTGV